MGYIISNRIELLKLDLLQFVSGWFAMKYFGTVFFLGFIIKLTCFSFLFSLKKQKQNYSSCSKNNPK